MGTSQGIFPGRVVWAYNPAATNENCTNTKLSDCFFMQKNNNQDTIDMMINRSIKKLSGKGSVKDAWDAIFKNFNKKKTGKEVGYTEGQTIFIKVNNGQAGWAINSNDLSVSNTSIPIAETTPATVLAFLTQLVDSIGISQDKIWVGEPMTHLYDHLYNILHAKYPNVKYMDRYGYENLGRTKSSGMTGEVIVYSDKGVEMPGAVSDNMYNEMYEADYMINLAAMKAHACAGVTFCAKLHFGSHGNKHPDSFHLHDGLIAYNNDVLVRTDYNMYRVLVDLMGHEKLGMNTMLFVIDGLWGGVEATDKGVKWKSAPFNNDWPSSIFMSQDEIALESVGLDFLRAEATVNSAFKNRPLFPAVDDYLHQGAEKANWPENITYDPEGDGTPMPSSLGVHEHWNNATDKLYTKNLSKNGTGIDLVSIPESLVKHYDAPPTQSSSISLNSYVSAYPNPFSSQIRIKYNVPEKAMVYINIYNMTGQNIARLTKGIKSAGVNTEAWIPDASLPSGYYSAKVFVNNNLAKDIKMVYIK